MKDSAVSEVLKKIIISFLLAAGIISCVVYAAGEWIDHFGWIRIFALVGVQIILQGVLNKKFSKEYISPLTIAAAAVLVFAVGGKSIFRGVCGFANCIIEQWNEAAEGAVSLFDAGEQITGGDVEIFIIEVSFIVSLIVWELVKKDRIVLLIVICTLLIGVQAAVELYCFIGIIFIIVGNIAQWEDSLYGKFALKPFGAAFLFCVIFCIAVMFVGTGEIQAVTTAKQTVTEGVNKLRFGQDDLPKGNLYNCQDMLENENQTLEVTAQQRKTLYLKGFCGADYENGTWKPLKDSCYGGEYSGMLDWLEENSFDPVQQYRLYCAAGDEQQAEENKVKVVNKGADREYVYVPYSIDNLESKYENDNDNGITAKGIFGETEYEFTETSESLPGELMHTSSWVEAPNDKQEKYLETEAVYRNFVYDTYLEVDENIQPLIHNIFCVGENLEEITGVYAATEKIRQKLSENVKYTESPKEISHQKDPIAAVLTETKEANSAIFASIGVMAFREYGIPARYAEGYLLKKENIFGETTLLTNKNGHCWVEIYLDGVGWLPVDVTPGFYSEAAVLKKMVEQPQNVEKTAALEENTPDSAKFQGDSLVDPQEANGKSIISTIENVLMFILLSLVIFTAVAVLAYCLICAVLISYFNKKYEKMNFSQKLEFISKYVYKNIRRANPQAQIGWEISKTDAVVAEKFYRVKKGEYTKAENIFEKYYYGGQPPAAYEMRLLEMFAYNVFCSLSKRSPGAFILKWVMGNVIYG